jgi:hypothetical protein
MAFSRRDLFWYCAGVLSVVVIGLLAHVLNGPETATAAADATAAVPTEAPHETMPTSGGAAGGARATASMDEVLERLEARIAAQGGSDSDWELLAQTYDFVGRGADAKLARAHQLPASARSAVAPAPATGDAPTAATASAGSSAISGNVELSGSLKSKIPDGLTLFIVAKSVDSPGPPVAIVRTTTGHWPLPFSLDDSNAMMPGRNLSSAQHVTIEARASRSGQAAPQPGDFQSALITVDPRNPKPVRIVLDHVIG